MENKKHARLKEPFSPDLPDMEHAVPKDPASFNILVQALIGLDTSDAADTFNFVVCTPEWLKKSLKPGEALSGRHRIIVPGYDYGIIKREIETYCSRATGATWKEIAARLHAYGRWEYAEH